MKSMILVMSLFSTVVLDAELAHAGLFTKKASRECGTEDGQFTLKMNISEKSGEDPQVTVVIKDRNVVIVSVEGDVDSGITPYKAMLPGFGYTPGEANTMEVRVDNLPPMTMRCGNADSPRTSPTAAIQFPKNLFEGENNIYFINGQKFSHADLKQREQSLKPGDSFLSCALERESFFCDRRCMYGGPRDPSPQPDDVDALLFFGQLSDQWYLSGTGYRYKYRMTCEISRKTGVKDTDHERVPTEQWKAKVLESFPAGMIEFRP